MTVKRLGHMTNQSYILAIDTYGVFLYGSQKDGTIYDVKVEFCDMHPAFDKKIEELSDEYDVEDIDTKTFDKQLKALIKYFLVKPQEVNVPSPYYKGTIEKHYVYASHNKITLRLLELIQFHCKHTLEDIL